VTGRESNDKTKYLGKRMMARVHQNVVKDVGKPMAQSKCRQGCGENDQNIVKKGDQIQYVFPLDQIRKVILSVITWEIC
jgi:hypothetical protein